MSRAPRLQKLHLSHHPSRHGHPPTGRQPQQSARYDASDSFLLATQRLLGGQLRPCLSISDNWWSLVDCEVFSRLVEMYKSIVVFLLAGGRALLMPVFLESYIGAALRLLEKLHKVSSRTSRILETLFRAKQNFFVVGQPEGPSCGIQPLLHR